MVTDLAPGKEKLITWAQQTLLQQNIVNSELCIRIADAAEIQQLNAEFRAKDKPTNVLAFPSDLHIEFSKNQKFLRDVIICTEVVIKEAEQQDKSSEAHFAHMVVHGTLHLLGFDHIEPADAEAMENNEIIILKQLGYPYE